MLLKYLPTAYRGVFVSKNPRKVPCAANASTIAGAPKALNERNCSAGPRIGESCTAYKSLKKKICKQDYTSKTQLY